MNHITRATAYAYVGAVLLMGGAAGGALIMYAGNPARLEPLLVLSGFAQAAGAVSIFFCGYYAAKSEREEEVSDESKAD